MSARKYLQPREVPSSWVEYIKWDMRELRNVSGEICLEVVCPVCGECRLIRESLLRYGRYGPSLQCHSCAKRKPLMQDEIPAHLREYILWDEPPVILRDGHYAVMVQCPYCDHVRLLNESRLRQGVFHDLCCSGCYSQPVGEESPFWKGGLA